MLKIILPLLLIIISNFAVADNCDKLREAAKHLGEQANLFAKPEIQQQIITLDQWQTTIDLLKEELVPLKDKNALLEKEKNIITNEKILASKAQDLAKAINLPKLDSDLRSDFSDPILNKYTIKGFSLRSRVYVQKWSHNASHKKSDEIVENLRMALLSPLDQLAVPDRQNAKNHELLTPVNLRNLEKTFNKYGQKCSGPKLREVARGFPQYLALYGDPDGNTAQASSNSSTRP